MQSLDGQTLGGTLLFSEFNQLASELQEVMEAFGDTLTGANLEQLLEGVIRLAGVHGWATVTGTNTLTATTVHGGTNGATAYEDGYLLRFRPVNANTGAVTVALDGLAAVDVTNPDGSALAGGELQTDVDALLRYSVSAGDFLLFNPVAPGTEVDLGTTVISSDATVPIALPSGYSAYRLELLKIRPAVDGERLTAQISTNSGVSYHAGSADYARAVVSLQSSGQQNLTGTGNRIYLMDDNSQGIGTGTSPRESLSGDLHLVAIGDPVVAQIRTSTLSDTGGAVMSVGTAIFLANTLTATHIRFLAAASPDTTGGNLATGEIRLVGIR